MHMDACKSETQYAWMQQKTKIEGKHQSILADCDFNKEKIFEKSINEVEKSNAETSHAFMNLSSNHYDKLKYLSNLALNSSQNQLIQTELRSSVLDLPLMTNKCSKQSRYQTRSLIAHSTIHQNEIHSEQIYEHPTQNLEKVDSRNSASRVKKNKKRIGLKDRRDVVNKSLLRGIRKFFVWGIKQLQKIKRFRDSSLVLKKFNESISFYIQTLKIPVFQNSNTLTNDYKEQIQILKDIIGSFVNRPKYSKILRASKRDVDEHVQKFICLVDTIAELT